MTKTIEQLEAHNAELEKEVARLKKAVIDTEEIRGATIRDMEDYRQQLAIAEEHNARMRVAWNAIEINSEECLDFDECTAMLVSLDDYNAMSESLSTPASREALDKFVAEKVKGLQTELETERLRLAGCGVAALGYFDGCCDEYHSASLDDTLRLYAKYEAATKQRDLAVEALQFYMDNGVCEMTYYKVRNTLSAIKESEV